MNDPTPIDFHKKPEIQWRCLKCLAVHECRVDLPAVGPWRCDKCGNEELPHPEAIRARDGQEQILRCPACGCPDIYRQRDFNRKLGVGIVLLGAALAWWTYYLSIIGCVLIDVAIYSRVKDVVVCYYCHAIMRRYPGTAEVAVFDLNVSDKYIDVERKRGW